MYVYILYMHMFVSKYAYGIVIYDTYSYIIWKYVTHKIHAFKTYLMKIYDVYIII